MGKAGRWKPAAIEQQRCARSTVGLAAHPRACGVREEKAKTEISRVARDRRLTQKTERRVTQLRISVRLLCGAKMLDWPSGGLTRAPGPMERDQRCERVSHVFEDQVIGDTVWVQGRACSSTLPDERIPLMAGELTRKKDH